MSELTPRNSVPRPEPFEEAMLGKLINARDRLENEIQNYRLKVEGVRLIESDLFGPGPRPSGAIEELTPMESPPGLCLQMLHQADLLLALIDSLRRRNEEMDAELTALRAQLFSERAKFDSETVAKAARMADSWKPQGFR